MCSPGPHPPPQMVGGRSGVGAEPEALRRAVQHGPGDRRVLWGVVPDSGDVTPRIYCPRWTPSAREIEYGDIQRRLRDCCRDR